MGHKENILEKARKFVERGLLDKAIGEYRSAIDLDSKDISIRLKIGDLYVKMGRSDEAVKEYLEVARTHAQRGFYLKAIAVYKQILKLDAANIDVHNKLADLYTKQRLIVDAIGEYSYLVSAFEKKGKTSDVLGFLKKMIEIDPENVGIRLKLADHYQKLGFSKDALAEYAGIFSKLIAQGKSDKAEKIYHTLQTHAFPREPQVLSGLMELHKAKGENAEYLKYARFLAKSYRDSGETEQAVGVAEAILKIKPDDHEALGLLSHFHAGAAGKKPEPEITKHEVLKALDMEAHEAPLIDMPELHTPPAPPQAPPASAETAEAEEPLISINLPGEKPEQKAGEAPPHHAGEEGIEISIEGFEEHAAEAGAEAEAEEEIIETAELHVEEEHAPVAEEPLVNLDIDLTARSHAAPASEEQVKAEEFTIELNEPAPAPEKSSPPSEPQAAPAETAVAATEEEAAPQAEQFLVEDETAPPPAQSAGAQPVEEAGEGEEFVDLAAEVGFADMGLDEMIDKMAGSFAAGSDKETADEFKTGMENQLGKEDSETHYNLGIAYMEMELYGEASKEFKVAIKDARLEFDCYTRLGLCATAQSNHEDAVNYYLKGLKIPGKTDDERKGLMYELALAYEAASKREDAARLFRSIYSIDPEFREVAEKLKGYEGAEAHPAPAEPQPAIEAEPAQPASAGGEASAPMDDSMLEVELL